LGGFSDHYHVWKTSVFLLVAIPATFLGILFVFMLSIQVCFPHWMRKRCNEQKRGYELFRIRVHIIGEYMDAIAGLLSCLPIIWGPFWWNGLCLSLVMVSVFMQVWVAVKLQVLLQNIKAEKYYVELRRWNWDVLDPEKPNQLRGVTTVDNYEHHTAMDKLRRISFKTDAFQAGLQAILFTQTQHFVVAGTKLANYDPLGGTWFADIIPMLLKAFALPIDLKNIPCCSHLPFTGCFNLFGNPAWHTNFHKSMIGLSLFVTFVDQMGLGWVLPDQHLTAEEGNFKGKVKISSGLLDGKECQILESSDGEYRVQLDSGQTIRTSRRHSYSTSALTS
jgi:hypothetical protein